MKKYAVCFVLAFCLCALFLGCAGRQPGGTEPPETSAPAAGRDTTAMTTAPTETKSSDEASTLPEYVPGSIELDNRQDNYTFERKYRKVYYCVYPEFIDVADSKGKKACSYWFAWQLSRTNYGENQETMLLADFVRYYEIPREDFEKALEEYQVRVGIDLLDGAIPEGIEPPNADIIYTFDDEIINRYYRYDQQGESTEETKPLPEYVPGSIKLEDQQKDDYYFERKYRSVYYRVYPEFVDLLDQGMQIDYYQWVVLERQSTNYGKNQETMLLADFVRRYHVPREDFEKALEEYKVRVGPYLLDSTIPEAIEPPNADIIYTFDDEIINRYYRYDQQGESTGETKLLPEYVPGSIALEDQKHDDYDFERKYRIIYYRIWGTFSELVTDEQWDDFTDWREATGGANDSNIMPLAELVRRCNIPREDFEKAVELFIIDNKLYRYEFAIPEELEPPNVDIIYTFDDEIINEYYRYE